MIYRIFILSFFCLLGFAQEQTVYVGQIGHGEGFETTFNFMNLSTTTNRVEVRAFDNAGQTATLLSQRATPFTPEQPVSATGVELAGLGSAALQSFSAMSQQVLVGYAEIRSDAPLGVEVVFRRFDAAGRLITTTSVLPHSLTQALSFIAFANPFARSGVALLNPNVGDGQVLQADAQIDVQLFDRLGSRVGGRQLQLEAGQKIARFLDEAEFFPELAGQDFTGSVELRSDLPLAVTIIKLEAGDFFTTQTIQPAREIE